MDAATTSTDGTRIAYDRFGDGPPLIVVGGALCARTTTRPLAEALAAQFTVFNYDRRGRGDSGDTAPYAVEREIEDLQALLVEAGGAAGVYGHSSGAALVVRAAAQGTAITAVVLHEPPYSPDTAERRQTSERYTHELGALLGQNRRGDAVALFNALVGVPAQIVAQWRSQPWWAGMEALAPTLAYDSAVLGHADTGGTIPFEQLNRITSPALVLTGGASPPWMTDIGEQVAEALLHGQHVLMKGQQHVVPPEVLVPVLTRFFTAKGAPA